MAHTTICISCASLIYMETRTPRLFCWECFAQHFMEQQRAIRKVCRAVKLGELPPASSHRCEDCGVPAEQYDHRDYTLPLDVAPVCARCNWHRGPALDSQMRAVLIEQPRIAQPA